MAANTSWVNRRYGRKIGFLSHLRANAGLYAGSYRDYTTLDWTAVDRLIFICRGNICRSAYAHALALKQGLSATSAGLNATSGTPANDAGVRLAAQRGVDLSPHRSKRLDELSVTDGDLFVCMEPEHATSLTSRLGTGMAGQVTLLGLWSRPRRAFLQDPYGLTDDYWQTCLDILDSGVGNIGARLGDKSHRTAGDHAAA